MIEDVVGYMCHGAVQFGVHTDNENGTEQFTKRKEIGLLVLYLGERLGNVLK